MAIGAVLSLLAVGVVTATGAWRAATIVLVVLTCLALLVAWYAAMPFVLGSAAYALSRRGSGALRRAGTAAGMLGAAGLLLFVILVTSELLFS